MVEVEACAEHSVPPTEFIILFRTRPKGNFLFSPKTECAVFYRRHTDENGWIFVLLRIQTTYFAKEKKTPFSG